MRFYLFSLIFYLFIVKSESAVNNQDIINSVLFILENYFEGDCLTFIVLRGQATELELLLLRQLNKLKPFYLLNPINHTVNKIPYPCFYLVLLGEHKYILSAESTKSISRFVINKNTKRSIFVIIAQSRLKLRPSYQILVELFRRGHPYTLLLNIEEDIIRAYTLFPFGENMNSCPENGIILKLLDKWINNKFSMNLFPDKVPKLFNGCQLNVSYIEYVPFTMNVGKNVEGIDGDIVNLIGESLNMTIRWILRDEIFYNENGSYYGVLPDILYGRTQLACGGLVRHSKLGEYVHFTAAYATSYLTWYLPYPPYEQMWKTMYKAFQLKLLLFSIAVMFIVPAFIAIIAKVTANELPFFKCVTTCYVAAWALAVANTTGNRPRSTCVRIIYTFWLIYTMHLALAYTASLTGLLTKNAHRSKIRTFNDLINTGLPTAMLDIHQMTTSKILDPNVRKALDKFVIIDDTHEAISLIAKYGNMSILDNSAYVDYHVCTKSARRRIYNTGLSTFPMQTGLMMRKSYFLHDQVNNIVTSIIESGINDKLIKKTTRCRKSRKRLKSGKFKASTLRGLSGTFLILGVGLLIATVAFLLELVIYRRNAKKFQTSVVIPYLN